MPIPPLATPMPSQTLLSILRPLLPLAAVVWMVAVARLYGMLSTWSSAQWFLRRWDAVLLALAAFLALVAAELVRRWAKRALWSAEQTPKSWLLVVLGLLIAALGAYALLWQVNQQILAAGKLMVSVMGFYLGVLLVSHEPKGGFFASVSGFFLSAVLLVTMPTAELGRAGNVVRGWAILSLVGGSFSVYLHDRSKGPNRNPIPKAFVAAALCVLAINLSSFVWAGEASAPHLDYPLLLLALLAVLALTRILQTENFSECDGSSLMVSRVVIQSGFPLVVIAAAYIFSQNPDSAQKAFLIGIMLSASLGLILYLKRSQITDLLRTHGSDLVFLLGGCVAVLAFAWV